MKAEIISIGTELLLGQIVNTNAQYISEQLAMLGIPVYYHSVVGDNPERIRSQLEISTERSDILIFTGGLGPTKDDLTKETIAQFLQRSLVLDEVAMEQIRDFFKKRNVVMTSNNERQAIVIEESTIFQNKNGLAPGMVQYSQSTHFMLFPGPPRELKPMFEEYAIPYLLGILPEKKIVHSKVMRFCGIGESALETKLQDLIDAQTNPTIAPLAKEGEVTLRLTSLANSVAEAEKDMEEVIEKIMSRVGTYLYGWDNDTLQSVLISLLAEKNLMISTAESCTGGLLGQMISQVPGASTVFAGGFTCYTNKIKQQMLGISDKVIEDVGVVSEEVAQLLSENIKEKLQTDIGVAITGVAGPSEQEGKPVGNIYLGFTFPHRSFVKEINLTGTRQAIQLRAVKLALYYLINEVQKGE
jgi:nicotinamide-nucleotide amidase